MRSGRCSSNGRKRQLAAFGRFYQPGLKASSPLARYLARSSYFALECFAKTRLGS
jgi:hypothetical protein